MVLKRGILRDFDFILFAIVVIIILIGLLSINSATQAKGLPIEHSYVMRQINWALVSLVLLVVMVVISYQKFIDLSYIIYGINTALLILVLIIGHVRLGAQRWFSFGSFAFQPSEFIKLSLILALANYIGSRKDGMSGIKSLIVPCFLLAIPFCLVVLQPDLGTAVLLVPIFLSILLVGGADGKYIAAMIVLGSIAIPFFWHFLHDYQRQRLMVFINPNIDPLGAGYTIIQSKIAVGSGGLIGKGYLAGTQNQLNFLPERHTDFIFSVVGEEWGFLGALALIFLYFSIISRTMNTAALTSDIYGKCIATGVAVMIAMQVIINIAMTIGMMPVVGIPLPLVSYGGSSLLASLAAIGLALNVNMRRSTF